MESSPKKKRERRIHDLAYASRRGITIECSERPVFILRLAQDDVSFEVEVADFYNSEFQARLDRRPDYVAHLLDGGGAKHKDDRPSVGTITLTTATGEVIEAGIPAIREPIPKFEKCTEGLAGQIIAKDAKLESAFHTFRHVSLILCDRTRLLVKLEPEHFFRLYCPHSVHRALAGSRFREVYFATEFSSGPAVVPLKLLVAVARMYSLKAVCRQTGAVCCEYPEDLLRVFAVDLADTSASGVWLHRGERELEILYGDSGFLLDADLAVCVHLYEDHVFPEAERVVAQPVPDIRASLRKQAEAFEVENTLVTPIAFPVSAEQWREAFNYTD